MKTRYCLCEFIILLVVIFLYATAPLYHDQKYIFICFLLVLVAFVLYLRTKQFKNYLCFELIFIVGSLILYFIYPLFIYSPNTEYIFEADMSMHAPDIETVVTVLVDLLPYSRLTMRFTVSLA